MNRYRFRLKSGRVIGPFLISQIKEMLKKKLLSGNEEAQIFPSGDWKEFMSFSEFNFSNDNTELSRTQSVNIENKTTTSAKFNEFKFDKEDEVKPKLYGDKDVQTGFHDIEEGKVVVEEKVTINEKELKRDPTKIIKQTVKTEREDKTVIRPQTIKYLEEEKLKKLQQEKDEKEKKIEELKVIESKVNLDTDGTQVYQLGNGLDSNETDEEAEEIEVESQIIVTKEDKNEKFKSTKSSDEEDDEELKLEEQKKKKNRKVLYAIFVLAIAFIFSGEEKKVEKKIEYSPIYPKIEFPQQYEKEDKKISEESLRLGLEKLNQEGFLNKIEALELFHKSLEHSLKKNKAMGYYITTASELLPHSNEKFKDANTIFKLIQIVKDQIYSDVNVLTGVASFYFSLEKYNAANKIIEKFIQINKPTPKLFALYLKTALKRGDIEKARKIYDKLILSKNKSLDEYLSIMEFNQVQDQFKEASEMLLEAEKKYPKSIALKIEHANLLIYSEDFNSLRKILQEIESAQYENAPTYYAKYLEYYGLLNVAIGKPKEALEMFEKSLKIVESKTLRMKLAELDANDGSKASELILESKSINFILQSEKNMKDGNWELAFSNAINAKDIAPNFIKAQLSLAEVQIKQGYFQRAITNLLELQKKYSDSAEVNFKLIDAYIDSYKFSDANKTLSILSGSTLKDDPTFSFLYGRMYYKENNLVQSLKNFKEALNKNPVNEEIYFYLSKIYSRNKKFNEAKIYLQKAIDLDPSRLDFHTAYADILYETDDAQTAIGYLREILIDNPDNPQLLGDIGVYYYRSGQLKAFQETSDKLSKLPTKDKNLFEFLVKSSLMDEKFEDVLKYGRELLKQDPGNLEMRMLLAKILIEKDKSTEALDMLRSVTDRLDTYPKVQLYKSKLYLLAGDKDKAIELCKLEIESNPSLIEAYNHLGNIYKEKEDLVNAEIMFKHAQKIESNNVDALIGMAYIHMKRAQFEVALDLYKKAESRDQNNAEVRRQLGDAYRQLGQGSLAKESYKVYLELEPNSKHKSQIEGYLKVLE